MSTTGKPTFMQPMTCAPWCVDGDAHTREVLRVNQWCAGRFLTMPFSLEDGAQAVPITEIDAGAPHCNVYAKQERHALPVVVLHVFREHDRHKRLSVDADFNLTPEEAIELATNLIAVVEMIAGSES